MRFGRLAIVGITAADSELPKWELQYGEVRVSSSPLSRDGVASPKEVLLAAETPVPGLPELDSQRHLLIPTRERVRCEHALQLVADFHSVVQRKARSLASPIPCVAFIPENQAEAQWLEETAGIVRPPAPSNIGLEFPTKITVEQLTLLEDRRNGVQLLSEVHSQLNVLARSPHESSGPSDRQCVWLSG